MAKEIQRRVQVGWDRYHVGLLHVLVGLAEVDLHQDPLTTFVNLNITSSQNARRVKVGVLRDYISLTEQTIKSHQVATPHGQVELLLDLNMSVHAPQDYRFNGQCHAWSSHQLAFQSLSNLRQNVVLGHLRKPVPLCD